MAFFENIGKRINGVGQNVTQQTKNIAEISKLNSAIKERRERISELYMSIGQEYYERHKADLFARDREKIEEVTQLFQEMQQYQNEIDQIKGISRCSSCGAEIQMSDTFCNNCGAKIKENEIIVCSKCKARLNEGDIFCSSCGTRIEIYKEETNSVEKERYCPQCLEKLEEDAAFCSNCGTKVRGIDSIENIDIEPKGEQEKNSGCEEILENTENSVVAELIDREDTREIIFDKEQKERNVEETNVCTACGMPVEETDMFCQNCGMRLKINE